MGVGRQDFQQVLCSLRIDGKENFLSPWLSQCGREMDPSLNRQELLQNLILQITISMLTSRSSRYRRSEGLSCEASHLIVPLHQLSHKVASDKTRRSCNQGPHARSKL